MDSTLDMSENSDLNSDKASSLILDAVKKLTVEQQNVTADVIEAYLVKQSDWISLDMKFDTCLNQEVDYRTLEVDDNGCYFLVQSEIEQTLKKRRGRKSKQVNTPAQTPIVDSESKSKRIKKTRKIFDPSDTKSANQRALASGRLNAGTNNQETRSDGGNSDDDLSDADMHDPDMCKLCDSNTGTLHTCCTCDTRYHLACLGYTRELAAKLDASAWQCMDCRQCRVCAGEKGDATGDNDMIFCDACDSAYHMRCHSPPLTSHPWSEWMCAACTVESVVRANSQQNFAAAAAVSGQSVSVSGTPAAVGVVSRGRGRPAGVKRQDPAERKSVDPASVHGKLEMVAIESRQPEVPPNNIRSKSDFVIPDVSGWTKLQVADYFASCGVAAASTFINNEIDGASLLLLSRNDVITSLGLKLGVALKVYNYVRLLQTQTLCSLNLI